MNKFKLLAVALVFGTVSLFANSITNQNVSKEEIREQIVELVQNSQNTFEEEVSVSIFFTFSSEGEIIVKKVDSTDKDVLAFIRQKINSKKLMKPGKVSKNYKMLIVIK